MPIFDWFKRKPPSDPDVSRGGSIVIRYGKDAEKKPQLGVTEECFTEERERLYQEMFGECDVVSHEIVPLIPHIDVYVYKPGFTGRPFYTLVTGGMSDLPMKVPEACGPEFSRAEIICYLDEPNEVYIRALRFLARFPHQYETWVGNGHTIPNGQPAEPLFEGTDLTVALLMHSIVKPDLELGQRFKIHDEPVNFLWFVPITDPECQLKLDRGMDALMALFNRRNHPVTLNPKRNSYV